MRLGLESPSPRMVPQASSRRRSPASEARSSAFSPIDVDGDSADDADPPAARRSHDLSALSTPYNRPSLLDLSSDSNSNTGTKRRQLPALELQYESSDDSETKQSEHKDDAEPRFAHSPDEEQKSKSSLNFFFNVAGRSTPTKTRREVFPGRSNPSSAHNTPSKDELHEVISAARTSICGQKFDRCELKFGEDQVELTIWKDNKARWQGEVQYAHMVRFCFSQADRPPYILLLQLDSSKGRSDFATFYDPIFAKVWGEENEKNKPPTIKVFGVVFYFDEVMDYIRCQSMGYSNPRLAHLFREKLSDSEVRQYSRLDASSKLRHPRRVELKSSTSSASGGRSLASMMGNGARHALGSVTSFFRPALRPSVLEADDNPSVSRDRGSSTRVRTLNLSRESNEVSLADFGEEKTPISIDDGGMDKQDRGSGADNGVETMVVIQNAQLKESDKHDISADGVASSSLQQEEKAGERAESRKRAAASRREDGKLKRRRIESRRNEILLTYPYDGSDASGRISVTLGDVDRLVPGEFLNDNIIDFYLRFLWRHLDAWQQHQTYFFTSHFFTQLNGTNGAHELTTADPDERFARVARWTQKETNLFDKRFLFIPINDSFHWSIAVFCNPGSAIIKKVRRRRRINTAARSPDKGDVVDLVDGDGGNDDIEGTAGQVDGGCAEKEVEEEELQSCQEDRLANPPCLLFLDSLRCHRKKKFTTMLRNYLECEWKARYAPSAATKVPKQKTEAKVDEEESIVTLFDSESIGLLEPNIPLQSNSSDCGVFLLMYAASIVRRFPAGVTHEDLESNLTSTLTPSMFRDEHVLEFREYLQQLLFCLQFLEKHGLPEEKVKDEELELFTID
ncbi:hypothetical protein PHYPSEUDO_009265 [Phytophthora pseudosyringae]|uniref:Ubiquitin-like protease family profile domain-containing protein n=1 Tax=Phytophthora pseudosyringae TaxID=221518 RepID=A0A8T1VCD3_9STRA|nr:hypothetical protein PHYPSEUDO_009265 [Phytophthora pseudosyringae]